MRCLGKIIGLGLVALFLIVWPLAIWTFNIQRITLDVNTYKNLFDDEGFYEELVPGVLPALLEGLDNPPPPPGEVALLDVINHLDDREWERIAPSLVPVDWVEYEVETNLDAFLTWLEGDRDSLQLVFHTDPLRRRLDDSAGEQAMNRIAEALPPCTPPETRQLEQFINGQPVQFPYCQPQPGETRVALQQILNDARRDAVNDLPPDINVIQEMEQASREHIPEEDVYTRGELDQFRAGVRLWRRLLPLSLLIPAALLSLVVIVTIRSSKAFFRWMGWTLMVSSLLALLPFVLLPFIMGEAHFESELEQGFASGGELIAQVVSERLFRLLLNAFTWPVLIQSAILIVTGFLGVVLSVLLNDPDAPPEPITYPVYQTPPGSPQSESTPPPHAEENTLS